MDLKTYIKSFNFTENLTSYKRRKSSVVTIGDVPMGGDYPIRIQSMTTTDTMDTEATIAQSIRMIEAGCEYVRITAPSKKEAENLANIRKGLRERGYNAPLVADIHFTPNAAEIAARIVEKVRVNPGNYADKKKFDIIEYTDSQYQAELDRIRQKFIPLVKICKEYGTAMRIGTNHGSLSDRIMSRYGDTPVGMVESAMEFLRICEEFNYHNIVLSMKASNPIVMVQAYRLLVQKMDGEGMAYPLHLGVTEAGEAEDGRIKSAVGIGTLLEDGIGDTVRVSLTEDPEFEAPVAQKLVNRYAGRENHAPIHSVLPVELDLNKIPHLYNPYETLKRESLEVHNIGGKNVPRVIADVSSAPLVNEAPLSSVGYHYDAVTDKWNMDDTGADFIFTGNSIPEFMLPNGLKAIVNFSSWKTAFAREQYFPLLSVNEYLKEGELSPNMNFIGLSAEEATQEFLQKLKNDHTAVLVLTTTNTHGMAEQRKFFIDLLQMDISTPVIIKREYESEDEESIMLKAATDAGGLFIDGFGDGIWVNAGEMGNAAQLDFLNRTCFGILQATRTRISKTEYISCPSCGRTLFDLQETTAMIRKRTDHLKGVKIAIMGCIVNGPGEMADADYGYVGTGPGKITLYRGKEVVKKNIDSRRALDELIDLIREDGNWIEKPLSTFGV